MYATDIVDDDATHQLAHTALDEMAELARPLDHGVNVETVAIIGEHIASEILELANEKGADLIAITTRGRGASRLVVGSVADKILRASDLPLLVLHPQAAARTTGAAPLRAIA